MNEETTVDAFMAESPDARVAVIAVGSLARGCNLFITNEPAGYNHRDDDPGGGSASPRSRPGT